MKKNKKVLAGVVVVLLSSLFMGALIKKSEASLSVIKAGVDERGNPLCVNKNQVYLFKKDQAENKIIFYYHNPEDPKASVVKSFSDEKKSRFILGRTFTKVVKLNILKVSRVSFLI